MRRLTLRCVLVMQLELGRKAREIVVLEDRRQKQVGELDCWAWCWPLLLLTQCAMQVNERRERALEAASSPRLR